MLHCSAGHPIDTLGNFSNARKMQLQGIRFPWSHLYPPGAKWCTQMACKECSSGYFLAVHDRWKHAGIFFSEGKALTIAEDLWSRGTAASIVLGCGGQCVA